MKKIPKHLKFILLFFLTAFSVFAAYRSFFAAKSGSRFDAENFVAKQEETLAELADQCATDVQVPLSTCVNWAEVAMAWNSDWNNKLPTLWEQDCAEGQRYSCRRWSSYQEALKTSPKYWSRRAVKIASDQTWPVVHHLDGTFKIRDWIKIAMEGVVHGRDSEYDLVCGELQELPETLVCVSKGNKQLNSAMGRVISYIEQGKKILSIGEHAENPLLRFWQGMNLKRDDFNYATTLLKGVGPILPEEENIWQKLEAKDWKFLLTFNYFSLFSGLPSHEFLHGLYFVSSDYRKIVNQMIDGGKIPIKGVQYFIEMIFDTSDTYIKNNEIQAYLLQHSSFLQDRRSNVARSELLDAIYRQLVTLDIEDFRQGL